MIEYLPYKEFKWLKNVNAFDVISINEKGLAGYLLEVDLINKFRMICCRNIVKKLPISMR